MVNSDQEPARQDGAIDPPFQSGTSEAEELLRRDVRTSDTVRTGLAAFISGETFSEREGPERYQLFVDRAPYAIFVQANQRFAYVNPACVRMLGAQSAAEILGQPVIDRFHSAFHDQVRERIQQLNELRQEAILLEEVMLTMDGASIDVEVSALPFQAEGTNGALVFVHDISRRKQEERSRQKQAEQLRKANELLRFHLDNTPLALIQWDHERRVIRWSKRAEALFGWTEAEVIGKRFSEFRFIFPEDAQGVDDLLSKLIRGDISECTHVNRNLTKDGRLLICEWHNSVFYHQGETAQNCTVHSVFSLANDITERRQAEERLREVTAQLQGIMDYSPLLISDVDLEGNYRLVNRAICEVFGKEASELIGKSVRELTSPELARQFLSRIETIRQTCEPLVVEDILTIDGVEHVFDTVLFPLFDAENRVTSVGGIAHEITDRRQAEKMRAHLESQLRQSQKLEAVGKLAGGVAHDFNNMLSVILGHAELVMEAMVHTDPLYRNIKEIRAAARRSANLTQQLLVFARKQTITPKIIDLNEVIGGVLEMLRRLIGEDIELIWKPGVAVWKVKTDTSQIDQLLANLAVNARDAIAGTGTIAIETQNVTLTEEFCESHVGALPGDYVLLSISDDGCGMDHDTLAQIFEPFFTTKPQGEGTGLGLATVYGIVKQNQGIVNVQSELGRGSTFLIYLPRCDGHEEVSESPTSCSDVTPSSGTVLLVEDEPALLKLAAWQLSRLGYHVLSAGSPRAAIELSRQYQGEIQLLITDVIMPDMNGRDLWEKLSVDRPRMKSLFMSGYTADVIATRGVLEEGVHFLQKPFTKDALATKTREALAGK
jgi:two-component system, cell cycle sensor histidine kinase and response regulator CckA